jgi:hypothetical protein
MTLNFPSSPVLGDIHNASNGIQYYFDGVKWTSQGAYHTGTINTQKLDDIDSGFNGTEVTFNLTVNSNKINPYKEEALQIYLNDVIQEPVTDYTVDSVNGTITFASAPASGVAFFGIALTRLPYSENGKIINGAVTPASTTGDYGDFYIDTAADVIYGPKTTSGWGSSTSIIGTTGPQGPAGAAGAQGPAGNFTADITSKVENSLVYYDGTEFKADGNVTTLTIVHGGDF